MSDYWYARYLETLSQIDAAPSPRARTAYLNLADHYKAMYRLCGKPTLGKEFRSAA